jgi:hypothetical protein
MSIYEMFTKLSSFNFEIHNKINQIERYIENLNYQISVRDNYTDFPVHNEKFKQIILQEKLFYLNQMVQYKELYVNINSSRNI